MEEFFFRAMPNKLEIKVNMYNIPDRVVEYAEQVLRDNARHPAQPPPRVLRERYRRVTPAMAPC
ncbi:MAG: hypothetical protein RLZZ26_124 [Candidatus Parcubacteria bacterium]|jgi:hypothetical protein